MTRENTELAKAIEEVEVLVLTEANDAQVAAFRLILSALSAAPLHEGEGEPVAWRYRARNRPHDNWRLADYDMAADWPNLVAEPLYAAPPPSVEVEDRLRMALLGLLDAVEQHDMEEGADQCGGISLTAIMEARSTLSRKQEPGVPTPGGEGK